MWDVGSYLPFREALILEDGSDVQSRNICKYQQMLPNIPEVGRPQVLGCAWHFVTCYEYNFATLRTIPCWLSVTLPSDYSQLPFLSLQLVMPCPDRRLLVLAQRFVLPSVVSMNLSFDAVGVPITKVPCVPEKDNFLHGCITYALKMCVSYAVPSVSIVYLCLARYS